MRKNYRSLMKNNLAFLFLILCCTACINNAPRRPIYQKTATVLSRTIAQKKELIAAENKFIESYMAQDTSVVYRTSPFGFWYSYNKRIHTSAKVPVEGDLVAFEYAIYDLYNNVIYSKEELGIKKYIMDREDFIPGLQEGLKLMKVGETVTFIIPSHRAFGVVGDGDKITMNTTLKSTVTLLNIYQK